MAIILTSTTALGLLAAAALFSRHLTLVSAHGLLVSPRSRNYVAFKDRKWWGATDQDPEPENCPHCLNKGGTLARCGLMYDRNYDSPKNALGGLMPANIQATYSEGDEIVLDVVLTAHHKGHFEYKACPISHGEIPTQSCFDRYPLTFIEDLIYGAPPDANYPSRAYIAPPSHDARISHSDFGGMMFSHKYRLPNGLNGDLVLIQWHYFTSNSCIYSGYSEYNWPQGWEIGETLSECRNIPQDGLGSPEQFWNCAEINVEPAGRSAPSTTNETSIISPRTNINTSTGPTTTSTVSTASAATTATTTTTAPADTSSRPFFCGTSWYDAKAKCQKQCPGGVDSECPSGERCYADTHCNAASSISSRCGSTYAKAKDKCGPTCHTSSDCGEGSFCYAGIECSGDNLFGRKNLRG